MHHILLFVLILFYNFTAYSQNTNQPMRSVDIEKAQSSWTSVIGGTITAEPVYTSFGFSLVTDGRMMFSMTNKGKVIFQKPIKGKTSQILTSAYSAINEDFNVFITANNILNFSNPSGTVLWQKKLEFTPDSNPVFGRDGRIFVKGKNNFLCLSLSGTEKFNLKTEKTLPLAPEEFRDGSLLIFLESPDNSRFPKALHVTPFGKVLEEITFTSIVTASAPADTGTALFFESGEIAVVANKNSEISTLWSKQVTASSALLKNQTLIYSSPESSKVIFIMQDGSNLKCSLFSSGDGNLIKSFSLGSGNLSGYSKIKATSDGYFVCDSTYAREFNDDGTIFWEAKLPSKKEWSHAFYTSDNYLVLCRTSWVIDAYLMNQKLSSRKSHSAVSFKSRKNYGSFYSIEKSFSEKLAFLSPLFEEDELENALVQSQKGNYGEKEAEWISKISNEFNRYIYLKNDSTGNTRTIKTYLDNNPLYISSITALAANLGLISFSNDFATILQLETNSSIRNTILKSASKNGYDGNIEILKAIENLISGKSAVKISSNDKTSIFQICDTVFEICRFMGRPALNQKGKEIISYFFFPQFENEIREYARKTLQKIADNNL